MSGRAAPADEARLADATGAGLAATQRSRQPLPNGAAGWCRMAGPPSNPVVLGYRRSDGSGGWILLIGDRGQAVSAITSAELALPGDTATVTVTTPEWVRVGGVYQGLPDPVTAVGSFVPLLRRGSGLIQFENGRAVIAPQPEPTRARK